MDDPDTILVDSLNFEPDVDAEEELDGSQGAVAEHIDGALLTDATIRRCRVLVTTKCVEYGTTLVAPGHEVQAMLFVASFVFHPYQSRVKEAIVELAFNKGSIAVLQPDSIDDNETTTTISKKLLGELQIGHDGASATFSAERTAEATKKSALRIRGSGTNTPRAGWTLYENPEERGGIHLNFTTIVIAKVQGAVEVDVEVRAKLGSTISNPLGIRRIVTRCTKMFDGHSSLGFRPKELSISDECFRHQDLR